MDFDINSTTLYNEKTLFDEAKLKELESKFTFSDKQVDITACPDCRGVVFKREIYSGNPGDYRDNVRCSSCGGTGKKQQDDGNRNLEAPSQEG